MAGFSMPRQASTLLVTGALSLGLWLTPLFARAVVDPINELANAICLAPDVNAIAALLTAMAKNENAMAPEEVAEAFGIAAFLGDLQRCVDRQAVVDGFAYYKKGKDGAKLDAAFAMGRVAAKPSSSGDAGGDLGSTLDKDAFADIGEPGEPPSGH